MVRNYKIISIKHLVKGNRLANSGEVLSGDSFINLQESLKGGFCEETNEELDSLKLKKEPKKQELDNEELDSLKLKKEPKKK